MRLSLSGIINAINFLGPVVEFCGKINTCCPKTLQVLRDCHIFMDFREVYNDIEKQSATRTNNSRGLRYFGCVFGKL